MALQIQKGHTYGPGDTVDYNDLNQHVDDATVLKGMITQKTAVDAVDADHVLIIDATDGELKKALVSTLPSGVTTISLSVTPASVFSATNPDPGGPAVALTISLDSQSQRLFLASPASGSGIPSFRAIAPEDISATETIAANAINWSAGTMFHKTLTGNQTFTFTNPTEGQTIRVHLTQDASHTVTWPTVRWPGGTNPVMTTGAGRHDIYTFHYIQSLYWGTFSQDFSP